MQWEDLVTFRAVATDLSFTRAAQRLHVSKPVVSARVKRLERNLGVRLFRRDTRNVSLTELGRRFLQRIDGVTESLELAYREITGADRAADRPTVRVCLVGTAAPEAVTRLGQADQSFDLTVRWTADSGTAWEELRTGAVDVLVHSRWESGGEPEPWTDQLIRTQLIATSSARVSMGSRHRLAGRDAVVLRELAGERWIAPAAKHEQDSAATAVAAVAGYTPRFVHRPATHDETVALQRFCGSIALTIEGAPVSTGMVTQTVDDDLCLRTYLRWHCQADRAARCDALVDLLVDRISA